MTYDEERMNEVKKQWLKDHPIDERAAALAQEKHEREQAENRAKYEAERAADQETLDKANAQIHPNKPTRIKPADLTESKARGESALYFFTESVTVVNSSHNGKFKLTGILLHPTTTVHQKDMFTVRKYLREHLEKAAPTLVGKPIIENHDPEHVPAYMRGCEFTMSRWNNEKLGVEFEADITPECAQRVREGKYHGISAAMNWMRPGGGLVWVDGVAPFNFEFMEGSLISDPHLKSGDSAAYFKLMEAVDLWVKHKEAVTT